MTPAACGAQVDFLGAGTLLDCPEPGAYQVRLVCVHEHIRTGVMCDWHAEDIQRSDSVGFCLACYQADGHECGLRVESLTPTGGA